MKKLVESTTPFPYVTVTELSKILGVSTSTAFNYIHRFEIPTHKCGMSRLVHVSQLEGIVETVMKAQLDHKKGEVAPAEDCTLRTL